MAHGDRIDEPWGARTPYGPGQMPVYAGRDEAIDAALAARERR